MKQTVSQQALALVEKKLPAVRGMLSPQDAATATGITVDEAQDALTRLMELYITRITYDDNGNLLYAFDYPLRRRGTKTAAEKWAEIKGALWRGFKVFFKIWIGLMVVVYFVVMIVVLIALVLAQRSSSNDRDDDGPGEMIGGLFRMMAEGLQYAFWWRVAGPAVYMADSHGYNYRTVSVPKGAGKKAGKSFIIAIYDLALGPERASADPLDNEMEIAAYLRAEGGVLTPAEITALSGAPVSEAEERMADYLVRFKGDPTITDEGVVVGEFDAFVQGTTAKTDARIVPYWDEYEAPFQHSGNESGRNAAIIAMVLVTLAVGIGLLVGGLHTLERFSPFFHTGAARFLLGYFPIAFSLAYCLISLARLPGVQRRERARTVRNHEKRIMRVIFLDKLWRATADEIFTALSSRGEREIARTEVDRLLQGILPKLQGSIELDEQGRPVYVFERLRNETEAATRLRTKHT